MKRIANLWLVTILLFGAVGSPAQTSTPAADQSLGDYARAVKKDKKQSSKTFDNDNLPVEDKLSVIGNSPATASDAQQAPPKQAAAANGSSESSAPDKAEAAKMPEVTPGQSAEDRQNVFGQWKDKLSEQNGRVESLSHDIDVLQREYKLRVAEVYYDPANRARNDADADKQAADLKRELEEKQKALNDAKQDMESLQEDARKAGVPDSVRDSAENPQK